MHSVEHGFQCFRIWQFLARPATEPATEQTAILQCLYCPCSELFELLEIKEPLEVVLIEGFLLFSKILLGQAIEFAILFRLSDELIQLIEQFGVTLLHCDSPCLRILEGNEDCFGGVGVRKVIAIDRELIVEEAIGLALNHFGYAGAFICQTYDIGIGQFFVAHTSPVEPVFTATFLPA